MTNYRQFYLEPEDKLTKHLQSFRGAGYGHALLYAKSEILDERGRNCYLVCEMIFCFPQDPCVVKRRYVPIEELTNFIEDYSLRIMNRKFVLSKVAKATDLEDYPYLYLLEPSSP